MVPASCLCCLEAELCQSHHRLCTGCAASNAAAHIGHFFLSLAVALLVFPPPFHSLLSSSVFCGCALCLDLYSASGVSYTGVQIHAHVDVGCYTGVLICVLRAGDHRYCDFQPCFSSVSPFSGHRPSFAFSCVVCGAHHSHRQLCGRRSTCSSDTVIGLGKNTAAPLYSCRRRTLPFPICR